MNADIKCLKCGKCCWYHNLDNGWRPCRHLRFITTSVTNCKIYNPRPGQYVGFGQYCVEESPYNIKGCPYNKKGKPRHPFWGD